ncbi:MAG: hypothetical protein L0241_05805 [Planctomycetia bacterium]|nr:hypothetical protein [Planctomycetia bacterium]
MSLLLVFVMVTMALFALFLGGGMILQGYFYQQAANRMPIRALVAAVLVGGFITLWVWIDKRNPGRYDTFFNFADYTTTEFTEFEAVRWLNDGKGQIQTDANGNPVEVTVKFKRSVGGKGARFVDERSGEVFKPSGSTGETPYMTGALRVKTANDPEPVRYDAKTEIDKTGRKTYTNERKYVEQNGSRYIDEQQLGTLFVPSTGTIAVSLLLNAMLFVIWFVAFWPVLRFSFTHALMLAVAWGFLTMLLVMPLLFTPNRVPKAPAAAPQAAVAFSEPEA